MTYHEWIKENVTKALGQCAEVTAAMAAEFPELRRVRGHYHCPIWGPREHWWLTATDGEVVDPTVSQFPTQGQWAMYLEWEGEEPTGMCPNCGEYCFEQRELCSEACEQDYLDYITSTY